MASALGRRGLVLNRSLLRRPTAVAARKCSGGSSGGSSGAAATQPDVEPAPPTAEEKKKMSLAMKVTSCGVILKRKIFIKFHLIT